MSESTRPSGVRQEPEGCQTIKKEDVETLCGMGIPKPLAEQVISKPFSQSLIPSGMPPDHHFGLCGFGSFCRTEFFVFS